MKFHVTKELVKRAKTPHEISMLNLVFCHLVAAPAAIVLNFGLLGFLLPLTLSLSVIAFIWWRASSAAKTDNWFVASHWRISANRSRILLAGYLIGAAILGLALMATSGSDKGGIMMVALSRVAAVPVLLTVIVCFVLESGSIYHVDQGEVPDSLTKRMPPPADMIVVDAGEQPASS